MPLENSLSTEWPRWAIAASKEDEWKSDVLHNIHMAVPFTWGGR